MSADHSSPVNYIALIARYSCCSFAGCYIALIGDVVACQNYVAQHSGGQNLYFAMWFSVITTASMVAMSGAKNGSLFRSASETRILLFVLCIQEYKD